MIKNSTEARQTLAQVHPDANIHETVTIEPFAIIHEGVVIEEGAYVGSHCVIHPGVTIGKNCRLGAGSTMNPEYATLEFWQKEKVPSAKENRISLADNVHIEPHVTMHGDITIGEGSWIGSQVTLHDGARIGKHVRIFPGAVISAIPQDLKFAGERTTMEIGDHTVIRECATLNRGTTYRGKTVIGSHCLIMAYVHVAHDCMIGNHVIMANAVNMAGHVEVGDYAVLGGVSAYHQFVKIGEHAMVGGGSKVRKDVPPFIKVSRDPVQYEGVNSIGLRRRDFDAATINQLQEIYRHVFLSGMNYTQALQYIETHLDYSVERDSVVNFIRNSERGIIKGPAA